MTASQSWWSGTFIPANNLGAGTGFGALFASGVGDNVNTAVSSKTAVPAGQFADLYMNVTANGATITLSLLVNTVAGNEALSCVSTGFFQDTTHTDNVSAGNTAGVKLVGASSGLAECGAYGGLLDTSLNGGGSAATTWHGSPGNNLIATNPLFGCGGTTSTTETSASVELFSPGVLSNQQGFAVNGFYTWTSRVNAAAGNQSVTPGGGAWAVDSTHTDTVTSGQFVGWKGVNPSGNDRIYSIGHMFASGDGGYDRLAMAQAVSTSATVYGNLTSESADTVESHFQDLAPYQCALSELRVFMDTSLGAGHAGTVNVRKNGANGNGTVAFSTTTGWYADTTHSDVFNAGDKFAYQVVQGSGGNGNITMLAVHVGLASSTETSTGALAFGPLGMVGRAYEAAHGALAFGPLGMVGAGTDNPNTHGALGFGPLGMLGGTTGTLHATAGLGFGPLGMAAGGGVSAPASGDLAFGPIDFTAYSGEENGVARLTFGPLGMGGSVHVPPLASAGLAFGPIGIAAGGGGRVAELDVAALASPPTVARVAEFDVAVVAPPGGVVARVTELDASALIVPVVTTGAAVTELDVAALAYIGPCATSRCQVWKITRRDGAVFGFTSLDSNVTWRDVVYSTCKSLTTTAAESTSELKSAGNVELTGILDDASISDEDLYAGLFDDAYVEVWVIPYDGQPDDQAPFRQAAGWLGKVTRGEYNFTADVIGPGGKMSQAGIVDFVTPGCRWDFGVLDANGIGCPVDAVSFQLVNIAVTGSVLRSLVNFTEADPGGPAIWDNGKVIWQTGKNAGVTCQVETVDFGAGALSLWDLAPYPPALGDLFTLKPGCPKIKPACQGYGVYVSFGGFEDIPGPDALQSNADSLFT